ncbi:hypothetical protein IAT38_002208 [Cryptococcus sp. DSM 104549]
MDHNTRRSPHPAPPSPSSPDDQMAQLRLPGSSLPVSQSTSEPPAWRIRQNEVGSPYYFRGNSSSVGRPGTSYTQEAPLGTSFIQRRTEGLDNWESLQEMLGSQEGDDKQDDAPEASHISFRRLSELPTAGARGVRSMFGQPPSPGGVGGAARPGKDALLSVPDERLEFARHLEDGLGPVADSGGRAGETVDAPDHPEESEGSKKSLLGDVQERPEGSSNARTKQPHKPNLLLQKVWPPSPVAISVFKCAVAYLIASLFTFVPFLSRLLSRGTETDSHGRVNYKPADQAHMVATIVVYFNPAKTLGNMLLSTRYCVVLTFITSIASLLAMLTVQFFDHFSPSHGHQWDLISEIGDWVMCVVWIGGTMGLLAWGKLYVGNASWNGGCSMAAMLLYNVVIRDGALPKLVEILEIIVIGTCITVFVNFTVFPTSATTRLQSSISKTLSSFSTLLDLLTSTFLLEKAVLRGDRLALKDAIKSHAAAFKTLKNDLSEARNERSLDQRIRGHKLHLYEAAVASLGRLAQHLGGLRSCTRLQEGLIRASREGRVNWDFDAGLKAPQDAHRFSISAVRAEEGPRPHSAQDEDVATSIKVLLEFRELAGAQMEALNDRCDEALAAVQQLSQRDPSEVDLTGIRASLADSLTQFRFITSRAIKQVYAGPIKEGGDVSEEDEGETTEDTGLLKDGPNDTVFWIYFFLFTFEEFARELVFLLDTMQEISTSKETSAWGHFRSVFLRKRGKEEKASEYLYKQFLNLVPIDPSKLQPPLFPKNSRDSTGPRTGAQLRALRGLEKISQTWWAIGERMGEPDMRYAIKTGIGGALLALPAYTPLGREVFLEYRGEWALIAYLAAMSQTVGQTNYLSLARIFGTIIGGTCAVLFTNLFPENPIVLPILGFFFSMPCFYIITQMPDYTNAGRFILLTYNLSCLYEYNTRGEVSVELIAFRRSASVSVGVIWAGIITRYIWPFTARQEFRMGMSDFCLDLSYLYSKLVTTYSKGVDEEDDDDSSDEERDEAGDADEEVGEGTRLIPFSSIGHRHPSESVRQFMSMELHLQSQIGSLRGLLAQTKNEPRLKGPFAYEFYHEVLLSCERVLDRLHSMRCVTTRDEWNDDMRSAFIFPVNAQRREMAGNVILYFYTISAGLRLRTPIPPYLPSAEQARRRLVDAIRGLEVVRRRSLKSGGRHLLFFAYALAMQEVIAELEYLGSIMQEAYGVISHGSVEHFEELFVETKKTGAGAAGKKVRRRRGRGKERRYEQV